jgi:hypothetical protein
MMRRDGVPLAAFFVEADPPALALGEIILAGHADDGCRSTRIEWTGEARISGQ